MVAKPRFTSIATDQAHATTAASHIVPADALHTGVHSPAMALQARLDAAISGAAWAGNDGTPQIDRWPGAVRVAVLLGGAGASWVLVWQIARALLPA